MSNVIKILIFVITLLPLSGLANKNINEERSNGSQNAISIEAPKQVVENFYHNYLIGIDTSNIRMKDNAINVYVTQRLKDEINSSDIDWDYYIDAQDICNDWLGNIVIEYNNEIDNNAKVVLILGNASCESIYLITLFNDVSGWKIDSVESLERNNKMVK